MTLIFLGCIRSSFINITGNFQSSSERKLLNIKWISFVYIFYEFVDQYVNYKGDYQFVINRVLHIFAKLENNEMIDDPIQIST